jgi:hypothetical protein
MSQNVDTSQSQRIKQLKDRTMFAGYIANKTLLLQGVGQFPERIEGGTGALTPSQYAVLNLEAGAVYTTLAEYNAIVTQNTIPVVFQLQIISGFFSVSSAYLAEVQATYTQINLALITDTGNPPLAIPVILDDGNVPIPMGGMVFNFFGTNYSTNIFWNSNNAITFGAMNTNLSIDINGNSILSILLGNYDRMLRSIYYKNTITTNYSIVELQPTIFDYYTNAATATTYPWRIRLIKENVGYQRQFVEVSTGIVPLPSPGYSTAITNYPSGFDANGNPIDANGNLIDQTKASPYNITNGTAFLNLFGSTFALTSPPANTSFVLSSDSSGNIWTFTNNSVVNV